LPRVGSFDDQRNSEIQAKMATISACASTALCKPAWLLEMGVTALLKSGASRQEKASRCNRNGAASYEHLRHNLSAIVALT
jgi:hypothetical protein